MPQYTFKISQAGHSKRTSTSECADDDAARIEAGGMFADRARDIAGELPSKLDWQIEVVDEGGKPIFRICVLAESLK
jgi:hypothetical protein